MSATQPHEDTMIDERARHLPRLPARAAFLTAACCLVLVFAVAGAPIPLFNTYRAQDAITNADLGVASVGYFIAAATALLVFGRLSNHLGRRPVVLAALTGAGLSCLVLINLHGAESLFVARVLQGLACGLASSAAGAYVIDLAPEHPRWLPAAITGSAPMVGIPLGAIACGSLVSYAPAPRELIYLLASTLVATSIVLILFTPETMPRRAGALASLRPSLQVSGVPARLLIAAGAAFVATWSLGGFYQAFSPSVTAEYLHTSNALVAAAVFSSMMILNPIGGPISGKLQPTVGVRAGMALFVLALAGIINSLLGGRIGSFIGASLLVGVAQGIASTSAIRALLADAAQAQRAGLLSTIYLISYSGAAIPAMIAGRLAASVSLLHIAFGYAALGVLASGVAAACIRNR